MLNYKILVTVLNVTHRTAYLKLKGLVELRESEIDLLMHYFKCSYEELKNKFSEWRKEHND